MKSNRFLAGLKDHLYHSIRHTHKSTRDRTHVQFAPQSVMKGSPRNMVSKAFSVS